MHSLHQDLLRAIHRVQNPRKRGQSIIQWHWGAHYYQGDIHRHTGIGRRHGSNSQPYFQRSLLITWSSQAPHQTPEMGPGQRRIKNWKVRDLPQGDGKTFYPCVEQREITKDHISCSWMISTVDFHKSGPGGSDQVLQHVCRIFKESDRVHACPSVSAT